MTLQEYLRFTVTLVAVLDPFLAVPIFLAFTASKGADARRHLTNAVTVTVFLVLAGAAIFGEPLLGLIGASLPAFTAGGGVVLLLMALAMLNAEAGKVRQNPAEAEELESSQAMSGVVPLAVPLLAGPGAISTVIIAAQRDAGMAHLGALGGCILLVCAMLWIVLRLAQRIGDRMSMSALNVATRLFGLLLAAIAIEMMAQGLRELFPGLN